MRRVRQHRRVKSSLVVPLLFLFGCTLFGCSANDAYLRESAPAYSKEGQYVESEARATHMHASADDGGGAAFFDVLLGDAPAAAPRRVAQAPPAPPPGAPQEGATEDPAPVADDRTPQKRLMVYRGTYTVMVANVEESVKELMARAEALGGYLQSRADGTVTVRVPAERFFELTKELAGYGRITNESLEALDVTKQYVDLSLRIETAEKSRARLIELLSQATKMEDILRIESELRRLTAEVETMKGELRLLSDQIAFSTLTVRFLSNAPPPSPYPVRKESRFPWVNRVGLERVLYEF